MDRAILYTRVSDPSQVENTSLENQRKLGVDYCSRNNIQLVKIYREEGESAKFTDRTELKKALAFCSLKKNKINKFIVYKYDRFARDLEGHIQIKAILDKYQVKLVSMTEAVEESPAGRLMEHMIAAFAQFDNEVRSERTVSGIKARLKEGYWIFSAPIGYKRDGLNIVPDECLFEHIKEAWSLFLSKNYTIKEIATLLNNKGIRTPKGNKISIQTLSKVFRNKLYFGIINIPSYDIEVMGKHQPMITEDDYYIAQAILSGYNKDKMKPKNMSKSKYPLKGILKCATCDTYMTASTSKGRHGGRYSYYHCKKKDCTNKERISVDLANESYLNYLDTLSLPKSFVSYFYNNVLTRLMKEDIDDIAKRQELTKKLDKLEEKKRKLHTFLEDEIYSPEEYRERKNEIETEISQLRMAIKDTFKNQEELELSLQEMEMALSNVRNMWMQCEDNGIKMFIKNFFPKGIYIENGAVRTPETPLIINTIRTISDPHSTQVTLRLVFSNPFEIRKQVNLLASLTKQVYVSA